MLYPYNEYLLKCHATVTQTKYRREAERAHMLDQLCPRRSGWLADQACRVLRILGHILSALGRRLDTQSA